MTDNSYQITVLLDAYAVLRLIESVKCMEFVKIFKYTQVAVDLA